MISTTQERRNAALLLGMAVIMALDAVGLASIMPFVAVLSNPELIESNALINTARLVAVDLGYETKQEIVFFRPQFFSLFLYFRYVLRL